MENKTSGFLNERSDKPNEQGKYPYKHRNVRSAYASIKRYFEYLFTYEKYPELNIEKTTNRIEGLFKELKDNGDIYDFNDINDENTLYPKIIYSYPFKTKLDIDNEINGSLFKKWNKRQIKNGVVVKKACSKLCSK
ncbi:hypothetical protein [Actinobacillus equuli]|uniref:hypothetical protein n=1 Tax=Actinobacillus equuli TaxID=718 RepID=UPI002441DD4F|nr:hypothetical protein [Actinobacillus equuli]WGE59988.1 hypothetical protein NYR73_04580 [Actinobacillus equuli subsp. haemolyticus]WGE61365.1 hypothetical protein NYR74_00865 [Actinobacillus equuli subsp. haemolyticus]